VKKTLCAICQKKTSLKVLYKQNFSLNDINKNIFSARRFPDGLHYRIVRCRKCGLIFSNPVLSNTTLNRLYKESKVTYSEQISDLTKTYGNYLKSLENYGVKKEKFLEIGCGNGFLLTEAMKQGYKNVYGVEPSSEAVKKAPKEIRNKIKNGIFKNNLFPRNFFDVVCFFQTFDHIPNPNMFLKDCFKILKPGGYILAFNHNTGSFQASILGEKSPIIDIEHTYLYNFKTMRMIFINNHFQVIFSKPALNINSLSYLLYLIPLPNNVKKLGLNLIKKMRIGNLKFRLPIGNLVLIAQRPVSE